MNWYAFTIAVLGAVAIGLGILLWGYHGAGKLKDELVKEANFKLNNQARIAEVDRMDAQKREALAMSEIGSLEMRVAFEQSRVEQALRERKQAVDNIPPSREKPRKQITVTTKPFQSSAIATSREKHHGFEGTAVDTDAFFVNILDGKELVAAFRTEDVQMILLKDFDKPYGTAKFGVEPVEVVV